MYIIGEEGNRYFPALRSRYRPTSNALRAPTSFPKVSPCFPSATPPRSCPISHFIIRVLPWANRWPRVTRIDLPALRNFHLPPRWWRALDTTMDPPPSRGPRSLTRTQHFALPLIDAAGRGCSIIRRRFAERQERKPLPFKSSPSLTGDCKFARSGCAFRAFPFLSSKPEHGIIGRRDNISHRIYTEGRVAQIVLLQMVRVIFSRLVLICTQINIGNRSLTFKTPFIIIVFDHLLRTN